MLFAGTTIHGSLVAIRHDVPGRPLGLSLPMSVRTAILVGWGAGVAAPWALPAAALAAGRCRSETRAGAVFVAVGMSCLAGTLMEPVTYRYAREPASVRRAIALNLVASLGLCLSGIRQIRSSGQRSSGQSVLCGGAAT